MAAGDVAAVARLDGRAFGGGAWTERTFQAELGENRVARYFVLGEAGAPPLGYVGCWVLPDGVHIVTLGVDPAHRRRGLGAILVMRAVDLALEVGAPALRLECRASNAAAQALYRRFGFAVVGRRRRYYRDKEDALLMVLPEVGSPAARARLQTQRARLARAPAGDGAPADG
jgi:ribosomal-protein-alanine N-acetyltransferase